MISECQIASISITRLPDLNETPAKYVLHRERAKKCAEIILRHQQNLTNRKLLKKKFKNFSMLILNHPCLIKL
jgi:hypothetical protein